MWYECRKAPFGALCAHKGECDRDLAAGTAAEHYKGSCLNAPSIEGQQENK